MEQTLRQNPEQQPGLDPALLEPAAPVPPANTDFSTPDQIQTTRRFDELKKDLYATLRVQQSLDNGNWHPLRNGYSPEKLEAEHSRVREQNNQRQEALAAELVGMARTNPLALSLLQDSIDAAQHREKAVDSMVNKARQTTEGAQEGHEAAQAIEAHTINIVGKTAIALANQEASIKLIEPAPGKKLTRDQRKENKRRQQMLDKIKTQQWRVGEQQRTATRERLNAEGGEYRAKVSHEKAQANITKGYTEALQGILARATGREEGDPQAQEAIDGRVSALHQSLAGWPKESWDSAKEQTARGRLAELAMVIDTLAPESAQRGVTLGKYVFHRYRLEARSIAVAAVEGRQHPAAGYRADGGIHLNKDKENEVIIYDDGSLAKKEKNAFVRRRANGSPWREIPQHLSQKAEAEHSRLLGDLIDASTQEVYEKTPEVMEQWDGDRGVRTTGTASMTLLELNSRIEDALVAGQEADPEHIVWSNIAKHWLGMLHAQKKIELLSPAFMQSDGTVFVRGWTVNGKGGDWLLYPNGAATRYEGKAARESYNPDGTPPQSA